MEPKKRGGVKTPINKTTLIPQVAGLLALGKTYTGIAQSLNVGFGTVQYIARLDETKALVKEIGDSALVVAKATIKNSVSKNIELACEVLQEHLKKERSLEAVKLVFKVAGALADEPVTQNQGPGTIQVILPGSTVRNEKPTIETEFSLEMPEVNDGEQEVDLGPGET